MASKNYIKGRRKEYGVTNRLRKNGFDIAQRSKGSHSPIDVFAINIKDKIIKLIQVKAGYLPSSEEDRIYEENKELNGKFDVEFEVIN